MLWQEFFNPCTATYSPITALIDSKEQNRIRAQMSSGPQVLRWDNLLCAGPYTFFFCLCFREGSTKRHQKSVRCKKGRGISECRKLAASFLESVVYRHNFEVLIWKRKKKSLERVYYQNDRKHQAISAHFGKCTKIYYPPFSIQAYSMIFVLIHKCVIK